jgi:NADPH:quinone reductase-like Zn-dependent oxidoreductase
MAKKLKALGADVVLIYKSSPNWGEVAREKSPRGEGVDIVVEVGELLYWFTLVKRR